MQRRFWLLPQRWPRWRPSLSREGLQAPIPRTLRTPRIPADHTPLTPVVHTPPTPAVRIHPTPPHDPAAAHTRRTRAAAHTRGPAVQALRTAVRTPAPAAAHTRRTRAAAAPLRVRRAATPAHVRRRLARITAAHRRGQPPLPRTATHLQDPLLRQAVTAVTDRPARIAPRQHRRGRHRRPAVTAVTDRRMPHVLRRHRGTIAARLQDPLRRQAATAATVRRALQDPLRQPEATAVTAHLTRQGRRPAGVTALRGRAPGARTSVR